LIQQEERLPNLDAARFLAFVFVFIHHFVNQLPWPDLVRQHLSLGILGLDFFFVLSGFILSYRYLYNRDRQNSLSAVRNYLVRRIARTWPMYFLWMGIALICRMLNITSSDTGSIINWLSFSLNFEMIYKSATLWFPSGVLWSICVEEQLYLLVAFLLLKPDLTKVAGLFMLGGSIIFRSFADEDELYFHTLSYAGNFGLGLMLPYLSKKTSDILSSNNIAFISILAFLAGMINYPEWYRFGNGLILERLFFSSIFSILILNWIHQSSPLFNLDAIPIIKSLGIRSLGLYLYHSAALVLVFQYFSAETFSEGLIAMVISFAATILLTILSFKYFERPANKKLKTLLK